ncbi:MAG: cyclophilin-like fold protein [Clostridiales bacterium]|nr:cyclophilin-like fold protein [Clostridiales bacterium]
MKRYIIVFLGLFLPLFFTACGNNAEIEENNNIVQNIETSSVDSNIKTESNSETKSDSVVEKDSLLETERDSTLEPETDSTIKADVDNTMEIQTDNMLKTDTNTIDIDNIEMEVDIVTTNQIYIKVGENILTATLEDNESTEALKELLADSPLTITASNYGGFEKVCSLGTELPRNDSQITTSARDICLYNGNQIVIFYGSNSWAYTRLGKISDIDNSELEKILSGKETEITLSLEPFQ